MSQNRQKRNTHGKDCYSTIPPSQAPFSTLYQQYERRKALKRHMSFFHTSAPPKKEFPTAYKYCEAAIVFLTAFNSDYTILVTVSADGAG